MMKFSYVFCIGFLIFLGGCAKQNPDLIPIRLDRNNADRLLQFYLGGNEDVFATGIVKKDGDRFYLVKSKALQAFPTLGAKSEITFKDLKADATANYYQRREIPQRLSALNFDKTTAFMTEVQGSMTNLRRKIYVPKSAIEAAIAGYEQNKEQLLYPIETTIVAEHFLEGSLVEYTAMKKRKDGQWDFMVYDASGKLVKETQAHPFALKSPIQCTGCHYGKKPFEPQSSFPLKKGQKQIWGTFSAQQIQQVQKYAEHAKRSDGILGIYAGIYE